MASRRKTSLVKVPPGDRPLRALGRSGIVERLEAAFSERDGVAGAHCIHELWMRNEPPLNIERMLGLLWRAAPECVPEWLPMRYVDDSRTGIFEIDSLCVYVDFDTVQHKLAMDAQPLVDGGFTKPRANQLLIGLQEGAPLDEARDRVEEAWHSFLTALETEPSQADARALGFVEVYTWEDLQRPYIAAVEKEKVLVTILFALMADFLLAPALMVVATQSKVGPAFISGDKSDQNQD